MKIVVQRVINASVTVDREILASIDKGFVLLVCFEIDDKPEMLKQAVTKIRKLRIFDDHQGKMNLDIVQAQGQVLSISQFTLSWDGSGGHRPSFDRSLDPQSARLYYYQFNKMLREEGITVKEGIFGASMKVEIINDGPVTFVLNF